MTLKHDALGTVRLAASSGSTIVERDTRTAHATLRWLARLLARREAAALATLTGVAHVPQLIAFDGAVVRRSYLEGAPLNTKPPHSRRYFAHALRVLRALHRAGIVHNDLAKEANWIVGPGDRAGIVDFQIATQAAWRSAWFRHRAYEDLRHLLKHKRTYRPEALTARQRRVLDTPTLATRVWRRAWKPAYRFTTRALLRWPERNGSAEREI